MESEVKDEELSYHKEEKGVLPRFLILRTVLGELEKREELTKGLFAPLLHWCSRWFGQRKGRRGTSNELVFSEPFLIPETWGAVGKRDATRPG